MQHEVLVLGLAAIPVAVLIKNLELAADGEVQFEREHAVTLIELDGIILPVGEFTCQVIGRFGLGFKLAFDGEEGTFGIEGKRERATLLEV